MNYGLLESLLELWTNCHGITFYFGASAIGIKANKETCPQGSRRGVGILRRPFPPPP